MCKTYRITYVRKSDKIRKIRSMIISIDTLLRYDKCSAWQAAKDYIADQYPGYRIKSVGTCRIAKKGR